MKMKRIVSLVSIMCFLSFSLSACYDAREIDGWAYVYSIGVDKGVSDKLCFTFQIPSMKGGGGGGVDNGGGSSSGEEKSYTTISIESPTFFAGVNIVETSVSRAMNYMHSKFLIISEELAREGVEEFINGMIRSRQLRRIMYVIVVEGMARDFVKEFDPLLTTTISKVQEGAMNQKNETGFFIDTNYHDFLKNLKTTYRMPVAPMAAINKFDNFQNRVKPTEEFVSEGDYYAGETPRLGGNKFEFMGTALFDGDKMVGKLNGNETRALLMIRGEFDKGSIAIADPKSKKKRITIDTRKQKKPVIKLNFSNGKPVIHCKVFIEGDIQNLQSATGYESAKLKKELEDAFKKYIRGLLDKTVKKCQSLNVDAFGFGEKAVMHFLTIQEWEKYNWLEHFKDAEIVNEVEFTIRRTGTILKTNPSRESKGLQK